MNTDVYLFGDFNSGYSQYPDDNTSGIFGIFHKHAKATTQVVIHRDGNLMYYAYIRKLEAGRYIGLCVILNGLLLTRIDGLFSLFEHTISRLATEGHLIQFNEQGNLITKVGKLYMRKEEVTLLNESLRAGFNRFEKDLKKLPAISYGISKDAIKSFVIDDDLEEIIKSSHTNGYTFIYKSKGYNTAQMSSYKGVLTRVSNEKKELQKSLDDLQLKYNKTLRQKKQFRFVVILFVVLIGCTIGLFSLNDNLKITRNALSNANDTISMQNDSISNQNSYISKLHKDIKRVTDKLEREHSQRTKVESDLDKIKKIITTRQPFFIKKTSFDYNTGYLNFEYYGMINETVTLNVRAHNNIGDTYNINSDINIHLGSNTASIYVSRYMSSNYKHSFEILRDNVIIGGGRH